MIAGLGCKFIHFEPEMLPITKHRTCEKRVFRTLGPLEGEEMTNLRCMAWKIICNLDELKMRCIDNYQL